MAENINVNSTGTVAAVNSVSDNNKKEPLNDVNTYIGHLLDSIYESIPTCFFDCYRKYLILIDNSNSSYMTSDEDVSKLLYSRIIKELNRVFNEITKDATCLAVSDVKRVANTIIKNVYNKRQYLFNSTTKKIASLPVTDKKNPANQLYLHYMSLSVNEMSELNNRYAPLKPGEFLRVQASDEVQRWYNSFALFSEFPFLFRYSNVKLEKYINLDLGYFIADYIKTRLNYNLDSYLHVYPEDLIDVPAFSNTSITMPVDSFESIPDSGGEPLYYLAPQSSDASITTVHSLTTRDFLVLDGIVGCMGSHIYSDAPVLTIERRELMKNIILTPPSSSNYKNEASALSRGLDDSLNRLYETELAYQKNATYYRMHFLDSIKYDTDTDTYTIRLGKSYQDLLIGSRLVRVTDSDLKKLNGNLSRYILFPMQKRRIELCLNNQTAETLDYVFFSKRISFYHRHRNVTGAEEKTHMDAIFTVLCELQRAGVCISSLKRVSDTAIWVEYIPLTFAEEKMLKLPSLNTSNNIEIDLDSVIPSTE